MDFLSIIIIAVALAMDAFSVSISAGIFLREPDFRHYFRLSFHFGLFQFMMPVIGYWGGIHLEKYIQNYDHWIAFGLLFIIGTKMIGESMSDDERNEVEKKDPTRGMSLVILSVATSIDALAVGLGLGILNKPIMLPSIIIGVTCALFSIIGIRIGKTAAAFAGKKSAAAGGIMLILIGIKILAEHLFP